MDKAKLRKSIDNFLKNEREDEKSKNTLKQYNQALTKLLAFLPEEKELDKESIIEFREKLLDDGYTHSTIQNYVTIINKWLKYTKKKKLCIKNIKVQQRSSLNDEELLSPTDYNRLIKRAQMMGMDDYVLLMKVLAFTGIRVAELAFFTVENINRNKPITVNNKKKIRDIVVPTHLKNDIKKYIKKKGIETGYIFPGRNGNMLHHTTIYKNIQKIAAAESIKKAKAHPHAFRHLFAITFLEAGGQASDLKDILGHNSLVTTAVYTQTTYGMKKLQVEKIRYK